MYIIPINNGTLSVDQHGQIWRFMKSTGKLQRAENRTSKGYLQVQVHDNGKRITYGAHRLVWLVNYGAIPKGYIIHHIDGNVINNHKSNLMAMPHKKHIEIHELSSYPTWQNNVSSQKRKAWHDKTVASKHHNYLERAKNTYYLWQEKGMTAKEIAGRLGITNRSVYKHLIDYKKEVMPNATPDYCQRETNNHR